MNVLLTSVGRRVALARAFRRELDAFEPASSLWGADHSDLSAAYHVVDHGVLVPRCTDPSYISTLLELVRQHSIRAVVPLIDTELLVLSRHREQFNEFGCKAIVSVPEVIELARDKRKSSERFQSLGFRAPRTLSDEELREPDNLQYPLFLKPADGSSSIGAICLRDAEELRFHLKRTRQPVVQSLVEGEEYTIDVFADLHGKARCAVPRRRIETRAGEISKGRTAKIPAIIEASLGLVDALVGCRGCITLQCFYTPSREVVFFEMNPRFGGGFPLSYEAGANFPAWVLRMCAGQEIPIFDAWQDNLLMLRYDDAIFVPS